MRKQASVDSTGAVAVFMRGAKATTPARASMGSES